MNETQLLALIAIDPDICRGKPHIRDARISVAVILDALDQGLSPEAIVSHYPVLEHDDIRAALAYASQLARENCGVAFLSAPQISEYLQQR